MGEGILKDSVPEAHTDYIIADYFRGIWINNFNHDNIDIFVYFIQNY